MENHVWKKLGEWITEQIGDGGPRASLRPTIQPTFAQLAGLVTDYTVDYVHVNDKGSAMVCELSLKGGTSGNLA